MDFGTRRLSGSNYGGIGRSIRTAIRQALIPGGTCPSCSEHPSRDGCILRRPQMRLDPGQRVGVYEIVGSLGAGGMGEVYQARDTRLGRLVAIKFVSDELAADRVASERLAREARLTSLLNHPNIVTVHDVGDLDGRPFIVMEFVAGQSLHSAIHRERLKPARVIEIASQIADGLAVAHDAGIVHRDLKPRNIMLTEDGRAKIVDFGVGKTSGPAPGRKIRPSGGGLTDTFFVVGTAGYMAPEQAASRPMDFRADQFALGAIIYEMLTGRRAFQRDTPVQTMAAIVDDEPEPIAELAPDTPIELVTILERCLAKDAGEPLRVDARPGPGSPGPPAGDGLAHVPVQLRASGAAPRRRWRWVGAARSWLLAAVAAIAFSSARSDAGAAGGGARAARSIRQAAECRPGDRPAVAHRHGARPNDPAARAMLAEAYCAEVRVPPAGRRRSPRGPAKRPASRSR